MDTQLVYGTAFDVYDTKGRWAWGQEIPRAGKAGYVGYVLMSALSKGSEFKSAGLRKSRFKKSDQNTSTFECLGDDRR